MRRSVLWLFLLFVHASDAAADDRFGEGWPAGPNRELTGAFCGACHSLSLVQQQAMDRQRWDALLTWMSEKQNMPVVSDGLRDMLLDYLVFSFGPEADVSKRLTQTSGGLQGIDAAPLLVAE